MDKNDEILYTGDNRYYAIEIEVADAVSPVDDHDVVITSISGISATTQEKVVYHFMMDKEDLIYFCRQVIAKIDS